MLGYKGYKTANWVEPIEAKQTYEVGKTYTYKEDGSAYCRIYTTPLSVLEDYHPGCQNYTYARAKGYGALTPLLTPNVGYVPKLKVLEELTLDGLISESSPTTSLKDDDIVSSTTGETRLEAKGDAAIAASTGKCAVTQTDGDAAISASTGKCAVAQTDGEAAIAATTGWHGYSEAKYKNSIAIATGAMAISQASEAGAMAVSWGNGFARGALGTWLLLSEKVGDVITDVQLYKVDGVSVKPNVTYGLKDGKLYEVTM